MCFGSSVPGPPPPAQEVQSPDATELKRKKPVGMGGNGTVLTGPAGASPSTLNTGGTTLLGG